MVRFHYRAQEKTSKVIYMKTGLGIVIGLVVLLGIIFFIPSKELKEQDDNKQENIGSKEISIMDYKQVSATKAVIKTDKGDIELELYPNDAPKTVTNFATLATNGYFDNLTFHRYEPGFVIQGGDPNGNGTGGESIYGDKFEDELNSDTGSYKTGYKKGVLAMANSGPNTNGSQFFIILDDNDTLPMLYTIFGRVTAGMEIVEQLRANAKIISIKASD